MSKIDYSSVKIELGEKRDNVFAQHGIEWPLIMRLGINNNWTLKAYDRKPSQEQVDTDSRLALRVLEVVSSSVRFNGIL